MKIPMERMGGVLGLVLLGLAAAPAWGQTVRSPELNAQYYRAETAWRSGTSVLEAKARVDRVLRELPDDVEARKLRAQVLMTMDRPEEAVADARRAVALQPDDGEAHLILSEAARMSGDLRLARRELDLAARQVTEDPGFHLRLSWNAALLGQLDQAEAFARIALALDPTEAAAYYQLARVFVQKGQADDAAAILGRGLRASILDPQIIRQDSLLTRLVDHQAVAPLLRR